MIRLGPAFFGLWLGRGGLGLVLAGALVSAAGCSRKGDEEGPSPSAEERARAPSPSAEERVQGPSPEAAERKEQHGPDPRIYGVTVPEGTSRVDGLYREASARLNKGDTAGARELYRAAIAAEPESPLGHIGLGGCSMHEHDLAAARASYERAREIDPKVVSAHIGLGSVAYLEGRFRDAARHYEAAAEIDDKVADAHWGAAAAYDALGDAERRRLHAARFLALAPDSTLAPRAREMLGRFR
jgi:tetratricopeptide (TPR) repeat protein